MYELRQLQALVTIKRAGSFTAAADLLGYSQPAVSYQMRRLQQDVGTRLFIQTARGVRLTEAGSVLAKHAEAVFAAMRAAEKELASLAALGGAVVRAEAFQSICATLIPGAATRLRAQGRDLRLVLHQAEPVEARARVRDGEADLALLAMWDNEPLPDGEEGMERIPLMSDRRCVVLPAGHPLAGQATIDFADLGGESWVMESFRDRFEMACRENGFAPRIAATTDDHMTIQSLVSAGLGITLVNELGLHAYLAPGLVARPLRDWPRRIIYALLWPGMTTVPAVEGVLAALRQSAQALRDEIPGSERTARVRPRGGPLPSAGLPGTAAGDLPSGLARVDGRIGNSSTATPHRLPVQCTISVYPIRARHDDTGLITRLGRRGSRVRGAVRSAAPSVSARDGVSGSLAWHFGSWEQTSIVCRRVISKVVSS
jgi:DNA-binding transcriptional LysR family regulator